MHMCKKVISLLLCLLLTASAASVSLTASAADAPKTDPVIFVLGIGQSQSYLYDDNGNVIDDWNLFAPTIPYDEDAGKLNLKAYTPLEWLKLLRFVGQLLASFILDVDIVRPDAIGDTLEILLQNHMKDDDGNFVNNVQTPRYAYPVSQYAEGSDERRNFYKRIPCEQLAEAIGEENLYMYTYSLFCNAYKNADELNDFIEDVVLPQTGAEKVILVPMSMGASVVNAYYDLYPDANSVSKVISIVGAWDGSDVFADLLLSDFDENAPDLVYTDAVDILDAGAAGYIINLVARLMPKRQVDRLLYDIVDQLNERLILDNTSLISVLPHERYPEYAEKYLSGDSMAKVRAEAERYAKAQENVSERLLYQQNTYGTEFYFISGYDMGFGDGDYAVFHFMESWDETNSDEIIQISSTAPGTSFVTSGTSFDKAYIADPAHNVSPDGSVDASTCTFEDTSWYFRGQKHELNDNNIALQLAFDIALDKVKSVNDCRDTYPQFNGSRDLWQLTRDFEQIEKTDLSALSDADRQRLEDAVRDAKAMAARTILDREADDKIAEALHQIMIELHVQYGVFNNYYNPKDTTPDKAEVILHNISDFMTKVFGKKGIADFWKFWM